MHIVLLTSEIRMDAAGSARRRGAAWSEWPGVCVVLQAAMRVRQRLDAIRFTIVGSGLLVQRVEPELARLGLDSVSVASAGRDERLFELLGRCEACAWHAASPDRTLARLPDAILPAMALDVPVLLAAYGPAVDALLDADAGLAMAPDVADSLLDGIEELREFPKACRNGRSWLASRPALERHPLVGMADRWRSGAIAARIESHERRDAA